MRTEEYNQSPKSWTSATQRWQCLGFLLAEFTPFLISQNSQIYPSHNLFCFTFPQTVGGLFSIPLLRFYETLELIHIESCMSLLDSQKELFLSQIDQLHNIVVNQCKHTSVNPLSQEMAAGALSIKIGKRPRDLLKPKAIKHMQSVFSIKDAINKKETREISVLYGITVTQVRDFFTAQRTRVRKLLRLSGEKASTSNASSEGPCVIPLSSEPNLQTEPVPLDSVAPTCTEEGPSCSTQDEVLTGIGELDKHFISNILNLMRKVETFSGQVKLMNWILQVQTRSVLCWFLNNGGVMILATWLSQAAAEEQTSVLDVILKVLCHLPLQKAFPAHMSAILQSVNRLRFYRTTDISRRARQLLAKWSNMCAKREAMMKRNGIKSAADSPGELLLQKSLGEVMGNEIWQSKLEEESHASLAGASENSRKLDSAQPLKLLTASSDDSNKRLSKGASTSMTRERRKVQLMEQPSQRMAGRSLPVGRPAPVNQGRPLSADDIQKEKMRKHFLRCKYGKAQTDDCFRVKPEAPNGITSPQDSILHRASKLQYLPTVDEHEKIESVSLKRSNQQEGYCKLSLDVEEPPWKRCRRMQIPWWKPPVIKMSQTWEIFSGSESKEVEIQNKRIHRERETIYRTVQEIPLNPKEPWDREMDPDDTLTTEIPIEQLPDAEGAETVVLLPEAAETEIEPVSASNGSITTAAPDIELLTVLLENPDLVHALTSGEGGNLSEETVKLLDMIKANGVNSLSSVADIGKNIEKKVEVSLPSPTPSSDPGTSGLNFAKNPFSQRSAMVVPEANGAAQLGALFSLHPQVASTSMVTPQQLAQQLSLLQAAAGSFGNDLQPSPLNPSINHNTLADPLQSQLSASESAVNRNSYSVYGSTDYNPHSAYVPAASDRLYGNILSSPTPIANVQQRSASSQVHMQSQPGRTWGTSAFNHGYQETSIPNHYNAHVSGSQLTAWRGNNYAEETGFESWSPDNSPIRHQEHVARWNNQEPRMNMSDNYRAPGWSQNPGYYSGYRGPGPDNGANTRWGDGRR